MSFDLFLMPVQGARPDVPLDIQATVADSVLTLPRPGAWQHRATFRCGVPMRMVRLVMGAARFLLAPLIAALLCLVTPAADAQNAPIPTAPTGLVAGTGGHPIFRVQPHPAQFFHVIVTSPQSSTPVLDQWFAPGVCVSDCELIPVEGLPMLMNGSYTVYMRGYIAGSGYTGWSNGLDFTIQDNPPPVSALALVGINERDSTPCPRSGGRPVCRTDQPAVWFTADPAAGDWVEVLILEDSTNAAAFNEWIPIWDARCESASSPRLCRITVSTPLLDHSDYTVYLRSLGAGGFSQGGLNGYTRPGSAVEGDPNDAAQFRVGLVDSPLANLNGTIIQGDVRLRWDHLPFVSWYELVVADADGHILTWQWYAADALGCAEICRVDPEAAFPNGLYMWAVRYWNAAVSGWFIAPETIVLDAPPPESPAPKPSEQGVFRWLAVPHAAWYQLVIETAGGEAVYASWYRSIHHCSTLCIVQPDIALPAGNYVWRVQAWGPGGFGPPGAAAPFTVSAAATGAPIPIYPGDGLALMALTSTLRFEWQAAIGARRYQLQALDTTGHPVVDQTVEAKAAACGMVCTFYLDSLPPNGAYTWRIRAGGFSGWSGWVSGGMFHVSIPPAARVQLYLPGDGAIIPTTPILLWYPAPNAAWYRLTFAVNGLSWSQWHAAAAVCQTEMCQTAAPELPPGDYQWSIESWGPGNGSAPTPGMVWSFIKL